MSLSQQQVGNAFYVQHNNYYINIIVTIDASDSIAKLRETCQKLPECNKLVAGCLFLFLNNVAHHSEANRMSTNNLAIVFGQIVIRPKVESLESLLRHSPKINIILKTMIENYHAIIPVSTLEISPLQHYQRITHGQIGR